MLGHIPLIRLCSADTPAPILKTDRIRGQDSDSSAGQGRAKGLQGVADQPDNLTLAPMALTMMLMVNQNCRKRSLSLRQEQECRNLVPLLPQVTDKAPAVTILENHLLKPNWNLTFKGRKIQEIANCLSDRFHPYLYL
jgi:hypothetical protein